MTSCSPFFPQNRSAPEPPMLNLPWTKGIRCLFFAFSERMVMGSRLGLWPSPWSEIVRHIFRVGRPRVGRSPVAATVISRDSSVRLAFGQLTRVPASSSSARRPSKNIATASRTFLGARSDSGSMPASRHCASRRASPQLTTFSTNAASGRACWFPACAKFPSLSP